jgi:hypothetical protein
MPHPPAFEKHSFLLTTYDLVLEERITTELVKPIRKKIDLVKSVNQARLLERFLLVKDTRAILKYVKIYGLPCEHKDAILRTINDSWANGGPCRLIKHDANNYLAFAATLRWLKRLITAIKEPSHDQLEQWISQEEHPYHYPILDEYPLTPSDIRLFFDLAKGDENYEDWRNAERIFASKFDKLIFEEKFQYLPMQKKARLDFAKAYFVFHINRLVAQVHPAVSTDGKPIYEISSPFEGMCMELLNQYTGAAGMFICRNPNCEERFYIAKKDKHKPRSDKEYCGDTCQKWGLENLGRVRKVYDGK